MLSRNKNFSAKLAADVVKKTKDNATALTPSALRAEAAVALSKGGQIPNFGARGGDTQRQVANEMAKMMGEFGITPEQLAGMGADFKANSTSLATQTKAYDAMSGYMTSFHNNIKTWQEVAAGTDPSIIQKASGTLKNELAKLDIHGDINDSTNMTAWNNAMLSVKKQLGDPQAVAYVTATMAVAMDYSRIMAGGATGSVAQTAEGAREDAINLIDKGLSPEARQAQIEILEADTQGQLAGKELQIQRIKDRMKLIATATKTGTIQPSAEHAAQGFGPITVKPAPPQ